jgi:hypothetical protein
VIFPPRLARLAERSKTLAERRGRQKYAFRPIPRSAESAVIFGSDIWIKAPPYDQPFTAPGGSGVTVQADASGGDYNILAQSFGSGKLRGAAGFGTWYYSPYLDNHKRFSVLLQYDDNWWDSAALVNASTSLATQLWIWGHSENAEETYSLMLSGLIPAIRPNHLSCGYLYFSAGVRCGLCNSEHALNGCNIGCPPITPTQGAPAAFPPATDRAEMQRLRDKLLYIIRCIEPAPIYQDAHQRVGRGVGKEVRRGGSAFGNSSKSVNASTL